MVSSSFLLDIVPAWFLHRSCWIVVLHGFFIVPAGYFVGSWGGRSDTPGFLLFLHGLFIVPAGYLLLHGFFIYGSVVTVGAT